MYSYSKDNIQFFENSIKADHFGDLGVLVDKNYVTAVMASNQTVLIVIPGEVFSKLVWSNPCVMKEMLRSYIH